MSSFVTAEERATRQIHTAGAIIIGDEILNGKVRACRQTMRLTKADNLSNFAKTVDTNSPFFARWCFSLGINLKRIEVIADDEDEIIEVSRRMSKTYDLVVTSGGIGPTLVLSVFIPRMSAQKIIYQMLMVRVLFRHDDITYSSIAKAFGLELKFHEETFDRMKKLSKPHSSQPDFSWNTPSPALTARLRMVHLPIDTTRDEKNQVLFVNDKLWVPIAVVNGNLHILPGVPRLFENLLDSLKPMIRPRLADDKGTLRVIFSTPLSESAVAPFLTELARRVEPRGIKVGSYPRWGKKMNTVTLVGKDVDYMESLVAEIEHGIRGVRVKVEGERDHDS
ncbi:hypothetical protein GP486_002043 [Trichoglossum hirsutum]|uniref:MoaB/Mog domain-containing protein n=1 Tax=Trichoglossum hirsutum TaxID=265104 RepID=A0A9P8LFH8_9PEZI|nr:hypothetical protein GP486_002043 [Trichoglossum hirsutum]